MKLYYKKDRMVLMFKVFSIFLFGYFAHDLIDQHSFFGMNEVRQYATNTEFSYVNPLLECDLGQEFIAQGKPRPYVTDIQNYIDSEKTKGNVTDVSVYYRDLNNGPWIGIREKEKFFPASLLKVPISMYFYKESERNKNFLDTRIVAPQVVYESKVVQLFSPEKSIVQGNEYTYKELIDYAILYSDNDAVSILQNISGGKHIEELLKDLHLDVDLNSSGGKVYMSVRDYAAFFRILYNTSYLSQDNSSEFLELLSNTKFDQGLRKFIPDDIKIAHKFGEITLDDYGYSQLHDCGIVYYSSHPYIMCIMTRGHDKEKLTNVIANISRIVYEQIKSQVE